jgi:hypothetical protein
MQALLTTEDVMARYKLEDVHTAARYMHEAHGFKVGKRLFVRETDMNEWERKRMIYEVTKKSPVRAGRRAS